ncbi:hypothetical protein PEBR_00128 [Penicillium brasilianum]|uniref:Apple domain-containing protein n=1 Tax=Penicillium brasilianum TaxID=104259 RepID=A0A1S9S2E6_PENBI|nr:hypothetical protein PEBR_00128 [Penicillium brasilianum]
MSNPVPPSGLEVVPSQEPEAVSRAAVYPDQGLQYVDSSPHIDEKNAQLEKPRVCGLKRTNFWILVIASVVIITAAALGGGLGGGLSSRGKESTTSSQKASEQSQSTTSNSSTGGTVTNTASATVTMSAVVGTISGTTTTLYRDCPSSNDTIYNVEYNSSTYQFRKLCNMQAVIHGDHATYVNQATSNLNDCINLCAAYNENNVTKGTGSKVCSSVCWRNGFVDDDWPGQCFGYAGNNDSYSGGYNLQADVTCDSAIWINEA